MRLVNKMLADLEARQGLAVNSGSVLEGLSASAENAGTDRPRPSVRLNQLFLFAALAVGAWTLFSERGMRGEEAVAIVTIAESMDQPAAPAAQAAVTEAVADLTAASTPPTSAGLKLDYSLGPVITESGPETEAIDTSTDANNAGETREVEPAAEPALMTTDSPQPLAMESADFAPAAVSIWGEMQRKRSDEQVEDGASTLVNEARRLTQTGQIDAANARLEEALKQDPDHVAARSQLAVQWQAQGRLDDARRLLEEGLQRQPGAIEWIKLTARVMVAQGDDEAAIDTLARHPPQVAEDPDYHAFLAALYQRRSRHAEAITAYREVLRRRPDYGVWWMGLAISLEAEDHQTESLQAYRQAMNTGRLTGELRDFVGQKIALLSRVNGK